MEELRPSLLALDFDGVICDGLIEYFQTAWKAFLRIQPATEPTPPEGLAERFYKLRPVVETGWEMPVLLQALLAGIADEDVLDHWPSICQQQVIAEGLDPDTVMAEVDEIRDRWIAADLDDWLAQHRFYPGVIGWLQPLLESSTQTFIVTTKEGRFVRQLLTQQGVKISDTQIFGKEVRQPKHQTLRDLAQTFEIQNRSQIWFVEDRLKTLQSIQKQPDLTGVQLFLADWGYNTASDRHAAQQDPAIHLLSLAQLNQGFSAWLEWGADR